jgi:hypothetical protein
VTLVVSNDSDLRFPVEQARLLVPVGVVNPRVSGAGGVMAKPVREREANQPLG